MLGYTNALSEQQKKIKIAWLVMLRDSYKS